MDAASTYDSIGIVYMRLGNFQKALEFHEKALEITIKSLGIHHVRSANTKYNMALIHRNQGGNNQARIFSSLRGCCSLRPGVWGRT
jgi:hypothetical protein